MDMNNAESHVTHPGSFASRPALAVLLGLVCVLVLAGCGGTREHRLSNSRAEGDRALREHRYADAAAWYEAYLGDRPSKPEVVYDLATAYEGMGEPSAAREALTVAHELDPENPTYIEALARAMAANGETDAALDMLERIAAESHRADAHTRLGEFLIEQGFADEGVRVLLIAARLNPGKETWVRLADAYATYGATDEELNALRHAFWYGRDDPALEQRIRSLGAVPGPTFGLPPQP